MEESRGTKDHLTKLLFSEGELLKRENITIGRKFKFDKQEYLLTDVKKNTFKFALGQPLKSGELYGVIKRHNSESNEIDLKAFQKKNIWLIPAAPDENDEFIDYNIEMGDLLKILKPTDEEEFQAWPLKSNFEYYESRNSTKDTSKNVQKFIIADNNEVPTWYFQKKTQEIFAKQFIQDKEKYKHRDFSVLANDGKEYDWKLSGQIIFKEQVDIQKDAENENRRSTVFVSREGTYIAPNKETRGRVAATVQKISEEVPVIRLMYKFKVNLEDLNRVKKKTLTEIKINDNLTLKKYDKIRIPKHTIYQDANMEDADDGNEDLVTFYVMELLSYGENQFMRGTIVFPLTEMDNRKYTIGTANLGDHVEKILPPKYNKNTIIKLKPNDLDGYGEGQTADHLFHYSTIIDIASEKTFQYEIRYFPPWDKVDPWPIPVGNKDEIKKGRHKNPNEPHTKYLDANEVDSVLTERNIVEADDVGLLRYLETLRKFKQPIDTILDHLPKKSTSKEDLLNSLHPKYKVRLGNRSIENIPANEATADLEKIYWEQKKKNTRTRKRGGATKHKKTKKIQSRN